MKFKKTISIITAMTMMFSMTACKGETSKTNEEKEKVIVIGGSGPLSGDYASYGKSCDNGAQIAAEEINAAGGVNGYKITVKYEDDQADPAIAVNAYATLIDAGMKVSLGSVTSGACIAVAEESQKDGIMMITPTGSQKDCTKYDNAFRVCFTDSVQGTAAADVIADKGIAKKVAVLYDKSNDYSTGIYENFAKEAEAKGIEIVSTQAFTNQSNTDFSVQLGAIKSSGAEVLFLPIYAQEAAYVLTQANKENMDIKFFGCDGMDGIIEKIGSENVALTEGIMLLTPFSSTSTEEVAANFVKAYKEKFNAVPDQFAADSYDAVYAIVEAIKVAGVTDINAKGANEAIISAMTKIEIKGATGTMSWTADGEPVKGAIAVEIKAGQYEII